MVSTAERRGIQSVEVSAIVLRALASERHALSLKDISDRAGMPASKIHRYLSSFIRTGFVEQDPNTGLYDLGRQSLELGLAALSRFDVVENSGPVMQKLTEDTRTSSLMCIWGNFGPIVVRFRRSNPPLVTTLGHGSVLPTIRSATGQVFIAYLPDSLTRDICRKELANAKKQPSSLSGPRSKRDLDEIVTAVRRTGVAWVDSSVVPGLRGVAAPVLDPDGTAAAVVTLIGTDASLANPNHGNVTRLKEACHRMSAYRSAD